MPLGSSVRQSSPGSITRQNIKTSKIMKYVLIKEIHIVMFMYDEIYIFFTLENNSGSSIVYVPSWYIKFFQEFDIHIIYHEL